MKALILDFDGLILDTETTDFQSWCAVYEDHGVRLPLDEWVEAIGTDGSAFDPVARLRELTGRNLDARRLRAARRRVRDGLVEGLEPRPGVMEWVEEARSSGMRIAIASSSPRDWVEAHLERVGVREVFEALITADLVSRVKPAPDLYQTALTMLNVQAQESLALEDSPHGVAAARAAGILCVAVPGPMTEGCDFRGAQIVLRCFTERTLQEVMRDLGAAA